VALLVAAFLQNLYDVWDYDRFNKINALTSYGSRLYGKFFTALGTPTFDNYSAIFCGHTCTETVSSVAF
jgi:hypothetical protein